LLKVWQQNVFSIISINIKMQQDHKKSTTEQLEKIYDNELKWIQAGKMLRNRFSSSLKENPKLNILLKLVVIANIGVWLTFIIITSKLL